MSFAEKTIADSLVELEIKLAFQDDLLERLNQTVIDQQHQIDLLQKQTRLLYQLIERSQNDKQKIDSPHDELPPHY